MLQCGVGTLGAGDGNVIQQSSHHAQAARDVVHALCPCRQQVTSLVLYVLQKAQTVSSHSSLFAFIPHTKKDIQELPLSKMFMEALLKQ